MYTRAQEQLKSQMSADDPGKETSSNEEMQQNRIFGTPFKAICHNEKWHLIMGKFKLNEEELDTIDEVYEYMEREQWNIMIKVFTIMFNDMIEEGKRMIEEDAMKK